MDTEALEESALTAGKALDLVVEKLMGWAEASVALLPNLAVALLVILLAGLASNLVRKLVRRIVAKVTPSQAIAGLVATTAKVAVLVLGVIVALEVLHLEKTVTSLLAGAGVLGLALAFAFQDMASNLVAGVYLSIQRPMAVGDLVETQDAFGRVTGIDLRNTELRTPDGEVVIIPNKLIFEDKLVNFSRSGEHRVEVDCGVSYADDLDRVEELAREAVARVETLDEDRGIDFFYTAFGGSSIDFRVRFWVPYRSQASIHQARSDAIRRIKKSFDEHGITIPFPIRTLDFGIVGGESLRDAWPGARGDD